MKYKSIYAWIFAFIFMSGLAIYQRLTGPTHPLGGKVEVGGTTVKYSLPRTFGGPGDADVVIKAEDISITGEIKFKRFKSHDDWTLTKLTRKGNELYAYLPHLPPAGKVIYEIFLEKNSDRKMITKEAVILRFKGSVPDFILYPHIFFMFLAMVISLRAAVSGAFKWDDTYKLALWTVVCFVIGGLILGPLVQYYAFGALWTGWPLANSTFDLLKFGDLTDNKTLMGIVAWAIALWQIRKNPNAKYWAVIASIVLIAVYLIPHSALGSEIDFRELEGNVKQIN